MKYLINIVAVILLITVAACETDDDDVLCTQEVRQILVKVNFDNGTPDDFQWFTLRVTTGDTIRYTETIPANSTYVVLADDYQPQLEGKTEEFRFIGMQQGDILFNEAFVISADECHISKEEGPEEINVAQGTKIN